MIEYDEVQSARLESMLSKQRADASATAYEQLRQITAVSIAANIILLAILVALLTIR